MSAKLKLLITTLCVAAAATCIILSGHNYMRMREIDRQRMEISATSGAIETRLREDDSKAGEKKKRAEKNKQSEKIAKAADKAWEKLIRDDPALQSKRLTSFRAGISTSHGPFFQKSHLSSKQKNQLTDALVQRQADKEDLNAILANASQTPDTADGAWQKAKQESLDAFEDAVVSVLGEEGLAQLEIFEQDMPMWNYMGELASLAAQSGIPISLQQAERLVALMGSAPSAQNPVKNNKRMPQTESDWAAMDEQAKSFLTKEQIDLFRSVDPAGAGRFRQQFMYELRQAAKDAGHTD
jgi:hypothetical protein